MCCHRQGIHVRRDGGQVSWSSFTFFHWCAEEVLDCSEQSHTCGDQSFASLREGGPRERGGGGGGEREGGGRD